MNTNQLKKIRGLANTKEPQPIRTYIRDQAADLWHGADGNAFRLYTHGASRLALVPVAQKAGDHASA